MRQCRAVASMVFFLFFCGILSLNAMAQNTKLPAPAPGPAKNIITAIEVQGNQQVESQKILAVVSTKVGDVVDEEKLRTDTQSIYDLGLFTDVKEETVPVTQGVKAVFRVVENPAVKEVDIEGASLIPIDKLKGMMKTVPGQILNTRTLYADVLTINEYYASQGYTDPSNHVIDLSWSKDGVVSLKIKEGILIKVIEIQGNTVYTTARLRTLVHSNVGETFNRKKMEDDLGRIAELYKDDDYVLTGLKGNIQPDGTVVVDITETVVESMRYEGNKKTKSYVVARYIHTKVGNVLNKKKIKADIRRLNSTGYFSDVNVDPEEGTAPGKVILVWKLKEQRTGSATVGLGYSGASGINRGGLTGQITLSESNIKGTGQGASVTWQRGIYVDEISIGYTNPFIDEEEDSVSINYFNINYFNLNQPVPTSGINPFQTLQIGQFSDHEAGATITFGHPIFDEDTRLFASFQHENVSASSSNLLLSSAALGPLSGTINSFGLSAVRDVRDDIYDTSKGAYYSASFTRAGTPFGGTYNFNQYQEDLRQYFPIKQKYTIAFHVLSGWDSGTVPVTNWFVLGGPDTLRGYSLDSFIGTRMFLGQAEFRFPFGKMKTFSGAAFYDIGDVWQPGQRVNFKQLNHDYGIGIRMNVPSLGLGVIRLDFAFGGSQGTRTVIGIGQTF